MKNKINILVVDDNVNSVNLIKKYFSNHAVINVVDSANNGEEGFDKIVHNDYDLIILDLILPKLDGMAILQKMQEKNINKRVIVLTSYSKEETIRKVSNYGISYYMLKPFSLESLEKRIIEAVNSPKKQTVLIKENKLNLFISKMLHSLGVPSHIKGYQYIRESVLMLYNNPSLLGGITKELYPEIANKYDTTPSRVERAIRHAIEVSWNRGDYELMEEIFGNSVDYDRAKPTNSEFIATVADKLKLDLNNELLTV